MSGSSGDCGSSDTVPDPAGPVTSEAARRVGATGRTDRKEAGMKAAVGDQLIIEGPSTGAPRRDGEVVALHHEDGTPPYDVRWSDTGRVTLVFPGPDAHVHHFERAHHLRTGPAAAGASREGGAD